VDVGGLRFAVMLTRGGAVRWFRVARLPPEAQGEAAAEAD
jgi:magnesium and cobalt transporter